MERKVYDQMAKLDSCHWWFTARRRILDGVIERIVRPPKDARILELGAGTGHNLAMLSRFGAVEASELDTRLIMRAIRNTERVLKNANVDRILEIERAKGADLKIDDIHDQVAGVYPQIMLKGEMDAGAWSCGMVAGLIHDIPSVKELIDRIMSGAEEIINRRLRGFLAADVAQVVRAA